MYRRPIKDQTLSYSGKYKLQMASDAMFSFEDYNFLASQSCFYGADGWRESKDVGYGFYQIDTFEESLFFSNSQQQEQKSESYLDCGVFGDQRLDLFSPPFQACFQEIEKLGDEVPNGIQQISESEMENQDQNGTSFSLASLELLKRYDNGRINGRKIVEPDNDEPCTNLAGKGLSTEEVIRIAGARFIQSCCQDFDISSMLQNPFGLSFSDLSDEESKNVELVELLLASAEKVGYQQFERASKLLNHCNILSSNIGDPVQRVVYHFCAALRERIDKETGRLPRKDCSRKSFDVSQEMMIKNPASVAFHQKIPFVQVARFTAIQSIMENVAGSKRIHVIDLDIRNGAQWPVLMQALMSRHDCPLELLKISAIGTTSKQLIEDTGKRLASFAESMSIPFSCKAVMVSDILDLKKEHFELDSQEAVVIYSEYFLLNMISTQNSLESMMRMLQSTNPKVMVVIEVEANNNSPSFVNRFVEALFFFGASFDCFDACMERDDPNRMMTELIFYHQGIRNIVAYEGGERRIRHVKLDVWRSFFARFGMVETEISTSSLYQASLVLKNYATGSFCTVDMNEKSLLIGWKGTPLQSLSIWKFISQA